MHLNSGHHPPQRDILVAVLGTTPQIISETIFALAQRETPVFPQEIYIVTTAVGRDRAVETLLNQGILTRLAAEWNIPVPAITDSSFIIPVGPDYGSMEDIRDEKENETMGDIITNLIRRLTEDPDVRLHCSIAGGRKTMSFYLGAALQLFGRPWDKLYHVLVTPEFETNPHFFYPPRTAREIELRCADGSTRMASTGEAIIRLPELPFIRLRERMTLPAQGFRELVAEGQKEIDTATIQPHVKINLRERTVHVGSAFVEMVPVQIMVYALFLRQKLEHCKYPDRIYCGDCTDCFLEMADLCSQATLETMADDYRTIYGGASFRRDEILDRWRKNSNLPGTIRQNISKIKKDIDDQMEDKVLLPLYVISSIKKYGSTRYGVRVEKGKIGVE
ncbi:MAG: TIGR02584 family CRISPR-associated protein [Syntrophus sp. (in: bacteria)]|nr:TIGR02584 family CRISPR-associated protein [Syntrophus sp. (in: bacteria)]